MLCCCAFIRAGIFWCQIAHAFARRYFKPLAAQNVNVVSMATSRPYAKGYERYASDHPTFRLNIQGNLSSSAASKFKEHVLNSSVIDPLLPLTMFLVDDVVFTANTSFADAPFLTFMTRSDVLALSLRLHGGVSYCYPSAQNVMQPEFLNDDTWLWLEGEGDWRYAMSVDGNVYRTADVLPLLARLEFENPNSLEAAMAHNTLPHPFMNLYMDAPRLINIPANRVQDNFPNRHADSSLAAQVRSLRTNPIACLRYVSRSMKSISLVGDWTFAHCTV